MIFFGDEGFPEAACRMLDAFEPKHQVRHLTDEFAPGTTDLAWINALARRGGDFVFLTRDAAMLRRPDERKALQNSGAHVVMLAPKFHRLKRDDLLIAIVVGWRELVDQIERLQRPTVLRWHHRGNKRIDIVSVMDRLQA